MSFSHLLATLALSCASLFSASVSQARSVSDFCVMQIAAAPPTSEIEKTLTRKTKSEVKSYFGRGPDKVEDPGTWEYNGRFFDEDSQKTFNTCRVGFSGDTCVMVRFY